MYRAIVPEGEISCKRYEMLDNGVELYDKNDELIGFIPYSNLRELMNEEVYSPTKEERSIV